MNEDINIAEILKDVPVGTKLWSPIFGECEFEKVLPYNITYPILVIHGSRTYSFTPQGKYCNYSDTECMLYPSKNNRNWNTFKSPWKKHKHFEPAQKVLVKTHDSESDRTIWTLSIYSCCVPEDNRCHYTVAGMWYIDSEIIPYEGNENKLGKPVKV